MRTAIICIIGLAGSWSSAETEPLVEGRVLLPSGAAVPGARVLLFDLTDLRDPLQAAVTDRSGRFALPLTSPAGARPAHFQLGSNYPNPFNPSTLIPYQLPASMAVRLEVFNLLGQHVATLVDGEQPAGFHTARWDATDAAGRAVGAGVYVYRLSGGGETVSGSMLLIDGQAGTPSGAGPAVEAPAGEAGAPAYGLVVSGPGLVPYVDPAFRVESGLAPLEVVVEAPGRIPSAKVASGGILGDVDNNGRVDFFDALLVVAHSLDASIVMPNDGDISLGDVNADGQVDLSDAWTIAAYLNDPSDPELPAGIGEAAGPAASLSPDPSTVSFADDGAWHRFMVEASEPVTVVANPAGTPRRLEITTRSGRGNFCPPEADDDDGSRRDGQSVYLAGCTEGPATVELRLEADGTVLQTYTFEVTGSPADLVVQSISVSDNSLTPGQAFTLSATVGNEGTGAAAATTLRYYRSTNRTISRQDTQVGTDPVGALAASGTSAESIRVEAPSAEGIYYYGACVESADGESVGNNCSAGVRVAVEAAANRAPMATVSELPPQTTQGGDPAEDGSAVIIQPGSSVTVDVSPFFSDPDGEVLTYSASSSDAGVVEVSVTGSTVTFTGVAEGMATVTVTASDPAGLASTPLSATVTVTADAEEYTPVDWIEVVAGGGIQAQVGALTVWVTPGGGCLTVSSVVSDTATSFGTSRWQVRGEDGEWVDVSGTERDGEICGNLLPEAPGEYRWVVEITTEGGLGRYASGNTLVVGG